jgi:hypothetical protein
MGWWNKAKEPFRFLGQNGAFYHIEEQGDKTVKISLLPADGDGDGTVPTSSGSSLVGKASQNIALERKEKEKKYEHQNIYDHPAAKLFVDDALKQMVQEYAKSKKSMTPPTRGEAWK